MTEIHEEIYGNHSEGMALAQKALKQGYYWPTMKKDSHNFAKRCDGCQKFATIPKLPVQNLNPVTSPWPFTKWRINFIGPLPTGRGGVKFTVVTVDYFTKWCEAEPLAKIMEENTWKFVWKNIICCFEVPHSLVFDNVTQFAGKKFDLNCEDLGIRRDFSTSYYPQSNGQVEAVNKIIKHTFKKMLESAKWGWAKELPETLWFYRTTSQTATSETSFAMAYGAEAMIPVEVRLPSPRHLHFDEVTNDDLCRVDLDLQDERHADSQLHLAVHQWKMARYYNSKVRGRNFYVNDFVLKKVFQANRAVEAGTLGPTWEGPYKII